MKTKYRKAAKAKAKAREMLFRSASSKRANEVLKRIGRIQREWRGREAETMD